MAYGYDSFGRRLTRTVFGWQDQWVEELSTALIYQNQREVGAFESGLSKQLRVLGHGKGAELGAAVAVEVAGRVYAPLHDHRGNVCCLLNSSSGSIAEFYRYSAFGENQVYSGEAVALIESGCNNPWLFASKRLDPHTRLVQFGKRDYDTNLGRWITPDPIGFADGPNLYAYVQNSPLTLFDPWGLAGQNASGNQRQPRPSGVGGLNFCGGLVGWFANHFYPQQTQKFCSGLTHRALQEGSQVASFVPETLQSIHDIGNRMGLSSALHLPEFSMSPMKNHDSLVASGHQQIDQFFSTNQAHRYTPEAIENRSASLSLGMLPTPGSSGSTLTKPFTKSTLKRGQEMHKAYKAESVNFPTRQKEYILPSGKRPDFVDFENGIIYELKPNNPRSIRLGLRQLQIYKKELELL